MEKIRVTDEWLYKYMPLVDAAMIKELEDNTDYEYQFSTRFEQSMKELMRREAHPWINALRRLSKKASILFICVFGLLFILTMSVQAYRIKLFETVKSIWEDSVIYSYFTGQNQETIQCNEPGYIPEGYQEKNRTISDQLFSVLYINEKGEMITWDQMLVQDEGKLVVDREYDEWIVKEINGKTVMICLYDNGFVMAYYEDDRYAYVLTADNLSLDEVCLVFDSVVIN